MAPKKQAIVTLDEEQIKWLESKVNEGYSKSGLIRYAVKRLMAEPNAANKEIEQVETKLYSSTELATVEPSKPIKKVEVEKILDIFIQLGEEGKLAKYGFPNGLETAKSVRQSFKDIDYLQPRAAFMLGQLKVEMETMFNEALQKWDKEDKS